jgi:hypothetical protein
LLFGLCALIAVVAVCFFCFRDNEPSYNGRTLSEWLEKFDANIPPGRRWPSIEPIDATDAIHHLGSNCSPLLAHWVIDGATTDIQIARITSGHLFLQRIFVPLQRRAERKRLRGTHGLMILGTNATPAIPILTIAIHGRNIYVASMASNALFHIAPEVLANGTSAH